MLARWHQEIDLVRAKYEELTIAPDLRWFIIPTWPLPAGWSKTETALLVQIPDGYPQTPPYGFGVDPDLRLAGGGEPGNAGNTLSVADRPWRQFSYSVEEWSSHADVARGHNLLTFLLGVELRLRELS